MLIKSVYWVAMTHVCIKIANDPQTVRIKAAEVEIDGGTQELTVKDDKGKVIGRFTKAGIVGWWTEEDDK